MRQGVQKEPESSVRTDMIMYTHNKYQQHRQHV